MTYYKAGHWDYTSYELRLKSVAGGSTVPLYANAVEYYIFFDASGVPAGEYIATLVGHIHSVEHVLVTTQVQHEPVS